MLELQTLIHSAKRTLAANWTGRFTRPSRTLYPHQWSWDSGFVAIGYARYDTQRAMQEITSLFEAQWTNGMIPQIVFDPQSFGRYFPEPDIWQCERSLAAPPSLFTSGITMPPVHARAALEIHQRAAPGSNTTEWLRWLYPRLFRAHAYFYRYRDPFNEGLAYIRHPWESGLDNSPVWDKPLQRIPAEHLAALRASRKDLLQDVPATQRPTSQEYARFIFLIQLFRQYSYHEERIFQECPFVIQGPLFNAILVQANEALAEIGRILGEDTRQVEEWWVQTGAALREKLWSPVLSAFGTYDLQTHELLQTESASSLLPLFTVLQQESKPAKSTAS
jgi:hypothetical protein